MKKFVYVYHSEMTMAEREERGMDEGVKEQWNKWFGSIGSKMVDGGNPFAPNGMAVEKSGESKIENHPASGYSIVNAADMDEAVEMAKGCPVLDAKGGAVRVYEALPM
jgi:hypothetical protein